MKEVMFVFCFAVSAFFTFGQPSTERIKADLKKEFPNAISITVKGTGNTVKEFEDKVQKTIHRRSVEVLVPTNNKHYPNVKMNLIGGVKYYVNGSSYSFARYSPSTEELIGMPDPDRNELMQFVNENVTEIFRLGQRNQIIGIPGEFEIKANEKFVWKSFDRIEFNAWVTYERFINDIGDAEKVTEAFLIRMYRDDNGPWNRINAGNPTVENGKQIISTKKYSASERATIRTFEMLMQTELADKVWSNLAPLTLPSFNDIYGVMEFVHGVFMEGDAKKTESLLYNMLASFHFVAPDFKVLSRDGQELIPSVMNKVATGEFLYKNQYCPMPEVKEVGNGSIDYWNKDKSAYTRLSIGQENGKWKLGGITIYMITDLNKAKTVEAAACAKTQLSAVERGERKGTAQLKVKETVLAFYESDGFWYPATYLSYSNYYFQVQYLIDNSKSSVRKAIPFSIEVGDVAYVKLNDGSIAEIVIHKVVSKDVVEVDFSGQKVQLRTAGLMFKK